MRYQQGAITLLITALLLVAILVLSLASYKNVFFQAKRAQNEIVARQSHWAAEGGLECAFAEIQALKALPADFLNCLSLSGAEITSNMGSRLILNSHYGNTNIKKTVLMPGNRSSGALKATSNLYMAGGISVFPDPGKNLGSNEWECIVLRYSNNLKLKGAVENKNLSASNPPYIDFPTSPSQSCKDTHYTSGVIGNNNIPLGLKGDFLKDPSQKPFEDIFDIPRNEWLDLMYSDEFVRLGNAPLYKPSSGVINQRALFDSSCGTNIVSAINNDNDLIWHYGGCELSSTDLVNIDNAISAGNSRGTITGIVLVIQNGIFSVDGGHVFKGMLYHFVDSPSNFQPLTSSWSDTENFLTLKGLVDYVPDTVPDIALTDVAYFQNGSFNPQGGYVMDAPGTYAVFNTSISFVYNRDLVEGPLNKIRKIKWLKGSWHDF
ncbi:MAG: hypothetical protein ACTH6Y_13800 [Vibrio hibernica]